MGKATVKSVCFGEYVEPLVSCLYFVASVFLGIWSSEAVEPETK